MPIHITPEFLDDLKGANDLRFVRSVLSRTIESDGSFRIDKDDHRYDGIKDAWIRYVTRGVTAYRVIYIRRGEEIYLYRCGKHDIEDNLAAPSPLAEVADVRPLEVATKSDLVSAANLGKFLKTTEADYLNKFLWSMYHLPHREIYLISPFLDLAMFDSRHHLGLFLDRAVEEGTTVIVVTLPPSADDLPFFKRLEEREIYAYFLPRLHTKLYLFEVNSDALEYHQREAQKAAILGSSNLTCCGFGVDCIKAIDSSNPNEELCYILPNQMFERHKPMRCG